MAIIYRAPEPTEWSEIKDKVKIFLAGSIDMGKAEEWQQRMETELSDLDVIIFNPRRLDFNADAEYSAENQYMVEQIEWELEHIEKADIVVFYFDKNGKAPITLYELGLVSKDVYTNKKKAVIYCPDGYWKKANVDVNGMYFDFSFANNVDEFIIKTKIHIGDIQMSGQLFEEVELD